MGFPPLTGSWMIVSAQRHDLLFGLSSFLDFLHPMHRRHTEEEGRRQKRNPHYEFYKLLDVPGVGATRCVIGCHRPIHFPTPYFRTSHRPILSSGSMIDVSGQNLHDRSYSSGPCPRRQSGRRRVVGGRRTTRTDLLLWTTHSHCLLRMGDVNRKGIPGVRG